MVKVLDNRITETLAVALVRDQIVAILLAELANQRTLAIADSDPPTPFEIGITREKTIPWNTEADFPLCNVSYDTGNVLTSASPATSDQKGDHFYNLDIYVSVPTEDSGGTGLQGDEGSAIEGVRVAGIIYFIIMAGLNTRLQLRGIVGHRIIREILPFQPTFGDNPLEHVSAFRLRLEVRHGEAVPQLTGNPLEGLDLTLKRSDTTLEVDIEMDIEIT